MDSSNPRHRTAAPSGPVAQGPRLDAAEDDLTLRPPQVDDGAAMWRMARDSQVLDLNSSYAYLLWCHDFAATSVVACVNDSPVGFVTGYLRPQQPDTLMVWQVAVDERMRGRGLAGRMLHHLADRLRPTYLETTISPDNGPSMALFSGFARDRSAGLDRETLFGAGQFPDGPHEPEVLFRIGPLGKR